MKKIILFIIVSILVSFFLGMEVSSRKLKGCEFLWSGEGDTGSYITMLCDTDVIINSTPSLYIKKIPWL